MKKKLLFLAAIAGAMTLGSCVKDDVSGSVEAVRNAKLNQIQAQTELTQAQTVAQLAQAALNTANAESQAFQNKIDKATEAEQIAAALANYQSQIATNTANAANTIRDAARDLEADLSAALVVYGGALAVYQADQLAYAEAKAKLKTAQLDPSTAMTVANQAIVDKEEDIKALEAKLDAYSSIAGTSMSATEIQTATTAKQTEYNAAVQVFNTNEAPQVVTAAQDFWTAKLDYDKVSGASGEIAKVNTLTTTLAGVLAPVITITANDGIYPKESVTYWDYTQYFYDQTFGGISTTWSTSISSPGYATNTYKVDAQVKQQAETKLASDVDTAKENYDKSVELLGTESDKADATSKLNNNQLTKYAELAGKKAIYTDDNDSLTKVKTKYDLYNDSLIQDYKDLASAYAMAATEATKPAKVLAAKVAIGNMLVKLYGDFPTPVVLAADSSNVDAYVFNTVTTFAAEFEGAGADQSYTKIKQVIEQKAADVAPSTRADDKISAELTAQDNKVNNAVTGSKKLYDDAVAAIATQQKQINTDKDNYDQAVDKQKEFADFFEKVDLDAINKKYENLTTLMEAYDEVKVAADEATKNLRKLDNELSALNSLNTGGTNIDQEIAKAEADLAEAKDELEELKAATTEDQVIALLEEEVKQAEEDLKLSEADLIAAQEVIEVILAASGIEPKGEDDDADADDNEG